MDCLCTWYLNTEFLQSTSVHEHNECLMCRVSLALLEYSIVESYWRIIKRSLPWRIICWIMWCVQSHWTHWKLFRIRFTCGEPLCDTKASFYWYSTGNVFNIFLSFTWFLLQQNYKTILPKTFQINLLDVVRSHKSDTSGDKATFVYQIEPLVYTR